MIHVTSAGSLGLARERVEIADSNPDWKAVFDQLALDLRSALADAPATVEHVGSTSVPGLAAKPIIDIAIGVAGAINVDHAIDALERLGYAYRRDEGDEGGHLFVADDHQPEHRIAYVHVVSTEDPQWRRYLAFRDRLRGDVTARASYERMKRELAERFPNDREGYAAAKESFIRGLLT